MSNESTTKSASLGLKFVNGPEAGRTLMIQPPVVRFGRLSENDVCLSYDRKASRYHAELRVLPDGNCELADLGSTNGSIHGKLLLRDMKSTLQLGDMFTVGSTTFLMDDADRILSESVKVHQGRNTAIKTLPHGRAMQIVQYEAVLVADMQDSTRLGEQLGNEKMMLLKNDFFDLLKTAAYSNKATFTKGTGDGSMMTFISVQHGMDAIRDIHRSLQQFNQKPDLLHPLHVRLSFNFGETVCDNEGDRHGQAVNLCFRLDSIKGIPESVLVTQSGTRTTPLIATAELAEAVMAQDWAKALTPVKLPPQECKGFDQPVPVTVIPIA